MREAIIGHTGFVGGNLISQHEFNNFYNTKNIDDIIGEEFDVLVCSGIPAEKWKANQEPEKDYKIVTELVDKILQVKIKKLILISTVDVYNNPIDINENTPINPNEHQAYGKHRRIAEERLSRKFDTLIVRLPGLFGNGLKKNVVFDFLHNNQVEKIHSDAVYQFYYLNHLWRDISVAIENNISLLNISSEPLMVADIAKQIFNLDFNNQAYPNPASYDMKSIHAALFSGENGYLYNKEQVLADMHEYVQAEKSKLL